MKLLFFFVGIAACIYAFKRYKRFGHLNPLTHQAQHILSLRFGSPISPVNPNTYLNFFDEMEKHMRIPVLQVSGFRCLISPGTAVLVTKKYSLRVSIKIKKNNLKVTRSLFKHELPEEKDFNKLP